MTMFREGQRVSYIGENTDIDIGSVGRVLTSTRQDAHVMWESGPRMGKVDFVDSEDLAGPNMRADEEMAFETALVEVPVVEVYAARGARGLLRALADEGHTSNIPDIADQVIQHAASLVRSDPEFHAVIAVLGEDADEFVMHTVGRLLAQAGQECAECA